MEYSYGKKNEFIKRFYVNDDGFLSVIMGDNSEYMFVNDKEKQAELLKRMEAQFRNINQMLLKNTGALVVGASGITIPWLNYFLLDQYEAVLEQYPMLCLGIGATWMVAFLLLKLFSKSIKKRFELNKVKFYLENKQLFSNGKLSEDTYRIFSTSLLWKVFCGTGDDGGITINDLDMFTKDELDFIKSVLMRNSDCEEVLKLKLSYPRRKDGEI